MNENKFQYYFSSIQTTWRSAGVVHAAQFQYYFSSIQTLFQMLARKFHFSVSILL